MKEIHESLLILILWSPNEKVILLNLEKVRNTLKILLKIVKTDKDRGEPTIQPFFPTHC